MRPIYKQGLKFLKKRFESNIAFNDSDWEFQRKSRDRLLHNFEKTPGCITHEHRYVRKMFLQFWVH